MLAVPGADWKGGVMARVISFDKGSKRRLREIRWKYHEVVSAALLLLILMAVVVWFALFQEAHERFIDPSPTPEIKEVENR
jgi:hypothetical protein